MLCDNDIQDSCGSDNENYDSDELDPDIEDELYSSFYHDCDTNQATVENKLKVNVSESITLINNSTFRDSCKVKANCIMTSSTPKRKGGACDSIAYPHDSKKRKSDIIGNILNHLNSHCDPESDVEVIEVEALDKNLKSRYTHSIDNTSDSESSLDSVICIDSNDETNMSTNMNIETISLSSDSSNEDTDEFYSLLKKATSNVKALPLSGSWIINNEDSSRSRHNFRRYHNQSFIKCTNCNQGGHTARTCSLIKNFKCHLCGEEHHSYNCCNRICHKCLSFGHASRRCLVFVSDKCAHCNIKGHLLVNCPDLWRRYHLTTNKEGIVRAPLVPHHKRPLYCYSCGQEGHFGGNCRYLRNSKFSTWPCVICYDNPHVSLNKYRNPNHIKQGGKKMKKIMQKQRNLFQGTSNFFSKKDGNNQLTNNTEPGNPVSVVNNEMDFPRTPNTSNNSEAGNKKKRKKKKKSKQSPIVTEHNNQVTVVGNEIGVSRTANTLNNSEENSKSNYFAKMLKSQRKKLKVQRQKAAKAYSELMRKLYG